MKIAVLGGGNGAYAAAADLSEAGHEVRFWRRDGAALAPVLESGTVRLRDAAGLREVRIARPTASLGEAVAGAELIVLPVPAFAQASLAEALAPHLADGQVLFLPPGTFGSFVMTKTARAFGSTASFAVAETGTLPWLARKRGA
ncbi:MAG TPA: 2-dehydropantoate 2-reductase N-terminal domain-containing protein, partial [Hyphomicrobiales bacterium]|nr:2-dehydropantoate 2-reductase N-terminal domain-containing protein [Hyphomicrobiales bacterium]